MRRTLTLTTITALAGLLLTACGGEPEAESEPSPSMETVEEAADTPTPEPEPTPEVERNNRGSIVMQPGDTETLFSPQDDSELMSFTVHSIEVNPTCTGDRPRDPENGNFVVFEAEIESDIAAGEHGLNPGRTFNSAAYRIIDNDGSTLGESANTGPSHICFPESDRIPSDLGPGEKASGKVVFDVSVDSGSLLMDIDPAQGLQWEWEF